MPIVLSTFRICRRLGSVILVATCLVPWNVNVEEIGSQPAEANESQPSDGNASDAPSLLPSIDEQIKDAATEQKTAPLTPQDQTDTLEGKVGDTYPPSDLEIIPDVPISKDHTAKIKSDLEYEVLLEKCNGTLCTFFYSGLDTNSQTMKEEIVELARSLNGKATFAFVNAEEAKEYIDKAHLGTKLPTIVIADYKKPHIHPYFNVTETKSLQGLIERYERGEKKQTPPQSTTTPPTDH